MIRRSWSTTKVRKPYVLTEIPFHFSYSIRFGGRPVCSSIKSPIKSSLLYLSVCINLYREIPVSKNIWSFWLFVDWPACSSNSHAFIIYSWSNITRSGLIFQIMNGYRHENNDVCSAGVKIIECSHYCSHIASNHKNIPARLCVQSSPPKDHQMKLRLLFRKIRTT